MAKAFSLATPKYSINSSVRLLSETCSICCRAVPSGSVPVIVPEGQSSGPPDVSTIGTCVVNWTVPSSTCVMA